MKRTAITALSFALLTLGASTAFAQMNSNMSKSDMDTMNRCKSMSQSAMQKDTKCMAMMKEHPDMMKSGSSGMSGGMKK